MLKQLSFKWCILQDTRNDHNINAFVRFGSMTTAVLTKHALIAKYQANLKKQLKYI